jgi:hypothetical protein
MPGGYQQGPGYGDQPMAGEEDGNWQPQGLQQLPASMANVQVMSALAMAMAAGSTAPSTEDLLMMQQWQAAATAYTLQSLSIANNLLAGGATPSGQYPANAQYPAGGQYFPNLSMQLAAAAINGTNQGEVQHSCLLSYVLLPCAAGMHSILAFVRFISDCNACITGLTVMQQML